MHTPHARRVAYLDERRQTAAKLAHVTGYLGSADARLELARAIIEQTGDAQLIQLAEQALDKLRIIRELVDHELAIYGGAS